MVNLNIDLGGYYGKVTDFMIKRGYAKTRTEALRLALFEFNQKHNILPEEDDAFELVAKNILDEVKSGKQKTKKFDLNKM
jgi:hypothetical protein